MKLAAATRRCKVALLISIYPKYVEKIFAGCKTVELRKVNPRQASAGSLALVYSTSPVKKLVGTFEIETIVELPVAGLWERVKNHAGVSKEEFDDYYKSNKTGVGIFLKNPREFCSPVGLDGPPPQSFRYATSGEVAQTWGK